MANNPQKTLVILTPGFPENEADSTCIPPQQIFVKALKERYPELNIVVLTFIYPFFSEEYGWNGVRVISFGGKRKGMIYRKLTGPRILKVLKKLNKQQEIIGLLSFWMGKCAFIGDAFAKKYQFKHYCWLLGQDAKAGNKYFNKIKPEGASLIALSDFIVRECYKNHGVKPVHVIPVGIDTVLFNDGVVERDIDILGAGSLIPLKQYSVFVELIKELKVFFPNIRAVICGDGTEMEMLVKLVEAYNLQSNISFTGRLPHTEVLALMQRTKIFLHPSAYEGFGAVCLEALYAGAQVVSFVQPMDAPIQNWHIATDNTAMLKLLQGILNDQPINHDRILPYSIQANVKAMMQLFEL
jgi:glycosyltransferase involved in cell wall biosynthesis